MSHDRRWALRPENWPNPVFSRFELCTLRGHLSNSWNFCFKIALPSCWPLISSIRWRPNNAVDCRDGQRSRVCRQPIRRINPLAMCQRKVPLSPVPISQSSSLWFQSGIFWGQYTVNLCNHFKRVFSCSQVLLCSNCVKVLFREQGAVNSRASFIRRNFIF